MARRRVVVDARRQPIDVLRDDIDLGRVTGATGRRGLERNWNISALDPDLNAGREREDRCELVKRDGLL